MKILVCITHVPDTTTNIRFVKDNTVLNTEGVQFIIGPYDDYALARAVELKASSGAHITVLHVGQSHTDPIIRKALAIGADDAIRVDAAPLDSFFVATQIAEQAKGYDLILMGKESIDYNSGVVHSMTGELLGIPSISPVTKLNVEGETAKMEKETDGGKIQVEINLPLIAGCQEPIAEWKIPNMRGIMQARTKPLNIVEAKPVENHLKLKSYALPPPKGKIKMIDHDHVEELVQLLKTEAKVL